MPGKYAKRKKSPLIPILIVLIVVLAGLLGAMLLLRENGQQPQPPQTDATTTAPTETTAPPETVPPTTVPPETEPIIQTTASFTVTGDLLMHKPVFQSCWDAEKGDWVFDGIFTHVQEYLSLADYAVANLETTLCGPDNGYAYSGNPLFNCPDGIALSAKNAGFDMLLTGNNHCYDTRIAGIRRTLDKVEEQGLATLGTQRTKEDVDYSVIEVNGIKFGMTAFAAETVDGLPNIPSINAIQCHPDSIGLINSFDYGQLEKFYTQIGEQFDGMRAQGAEAIIVYLHWGEEYQLTPNSYQTKIAQRLCDMGVDVIVGGHPHVIQPVDLLTSTQDENQKTLIIYSTGNAVSNQRIHEMRMKSGHTEDGILFNFTFVRYSDGTVALKEAGCIPTWVYMVGNKESYTILPLDYSRKDEWATLFQISDTTADACYASYLRTMELVEEGLTKAQKYFDDTHDAKVAYLLNPPPETQPATEAPAESTAATDAVDPTQTETTAATE